MIDEAKQLREQVFTYVVFGLIFVGLIGAVAAAVFDGLSSLWFLRSLALVFIAIIAVVLQRFGQFMVAAYVLVLELAGIVVGIFLQNNTISGFVPYLFIPLIVIAGFMLSPVAIIITACLVIVLTLTVVWLTNQWSLVNLILLTPPLSLTLLIALLVVGNAQYRVKLTDLLSKNRKLLRGRTKDLLEAQEKVNDLQERAVKLQQLVLQTRVQAEQARHTVTQHDNKLQGLVQGTIRELNHSAKHLEQVISKMAEIPATNGQGQLILEETWRKVDHLNNFVVNLEALAELESGEVILAYQTVDITRLISEVSSSARGLVVGKDIAVVVDVPEDCPLVEADPDRLRQALMYLLSNAIKYTDEGRIEVQAEATGQELTIFVSDTGIGMTHEELDTVFDEFKRGDNEAIRDRQGTGLGLTISNHLVELHQGHMWATSTLGVGSTFYLAIPLQQPETAVAPSMTINRETSLLADVASTPEPQGPTISLSDPGEEDPTILSLPHPMPSFTQPTATPVLESTPSPLTAGGPRLSLSPVARLSSAYISRFGMSLVGLLLIIVGLVALLAILYQPSSATSAETAVAEVIVSSPTFVAPALSAETATNEAVVVINPTATTTNTPLPSATPTTVAPTQTPTEQPTEAPTATDIPPTATPLPPTSTPPTAATAIPEPTATPLPPSPTATLLPSPTVAASDTPADQATLVEPPVPASEHLSFVEGGQGFVIQNLVNNSENRLPALPQIFPDSRSSWSSRQELLITSQQTGNRDLYLFDISSDTIINLTQHPADDQHPAWSPDGEKVAFSSGRNGNFNIYVMDRAGTNLEQLTQSRGFDEWPIWSPDGTRLAFVSSRDGGNLEIYVMNADGSDQQRLTADPADDTTPIWSPDGQTILFASERDGNSNLYLYDLTSSQLSRLTADEGQEFNPAWSPDGQTIAFVYENGGVSDVYTIPAAVIGGGEVSVTAWTQITDSPASEGYPVWVP